MTKLIRLLKQPSKKPKQEQNQTEEKVGASIQCTSTSTVPFRNLLVLFSQEIVSKYKKKSKPSLLNKQKRSTMLPNPSKLVLATMQLVRFFERKKSPDHAFQEANFTKSTRFCRPYICIWPKINT